MNTTSEVIDTYEREGEIVNGRAKYYELPMLDEMFVRRSAEYYDFHNDDTSAITNRVFLEAELDYNSLNGYSDYHYYMDREMAYTNTLFENTTIVLGRGAAEYLQPETDIDFANSYIYIYPVEANELGDVVDYVKSGECVRKIPLPSNLREVTYSSGYGAEYTTLGFDVDLNAYVTEDVPDFEGGIENGTTTESVGMPKEGTYGAFVEIATYLEDENGEQIVISSNHYDAKYDNGETVVSQIEIPDVVFTYDYSAPEGGLYLTDEVINYIKNIEDIEECKSVYTYGDGSERIEYDLTKEKTNGETYYSDEMLLSNVSSKDSVVVRPGDYVQLYLANPGLEIGGTIFREGDTEYDYSYYAEGGNAYNYNENCVISYAFAPLESFDMYGNIDYESLNNIKWQHDTDEYERAYNKVMNITVPSDMEESCYLLVKFKDSTGNESEIYQKRIIPDTTAPTAMFYQYTSGGEDYINLIQVNDDYSRPGEIYVTDVNGTPYEYGTLVASEFKAVITGTEEYTVTLCDKAGNECVISLSDSGLLLVAPTVTNLTSDSDVSESMIYSETEDDMIAAREQIASSESVNELVYDTKDVSGNGHLQFEVEPGMGEDVYVDYAWSSESYKKLNNIESEDDYGYMWKEVYEGEDVSPTGIINAVVSEEPDETGKYIVDALVMLPAGDTDETYELTFRFRNSAGLARYYTVGYKVPATEELTAAMEAEDNFTNRQGLIFNQPVKIISPTYNSNSKYYSRYANVYCDANGNYEVLVEDLNGVQHSVTVTYDGKPYIAPDINVTSEKDCMSIELDMGYTKGYAMTFENVSGTNYVITPTDEEGRIVKYGNTTAYQYAKINVTGNTEITVGLLSEDGVTTDTYTYVVDSFIDNNDNYAITYSRDLSSTNEENKSLPVDAQINVPEGAEILSTDGNLHTFYKNGTYSFEVKTPEGEIKKVRAQVDWIEELETDSDDDIKPMYSITKYIRNEGELIDISNADSKDVMTNAIVQVRVFPFDINPETGELNPVTMTIDSENGNVEQSSEDEFLITFTDNDVATVTLKDPSGNKTTFDVTVDNINKEIPITGKIRYVRYGIDSVRAYILLPDGITLRSLDGIQMEEKSDGTVEYYHLFTQNGTFEFPLQGENGSTADVSTKYVEVIREPLVLSLTGKTPEKPDWGESQMMTVASNIELEDAVLTDLSGNVIDDMEMSLSNKKILVKFDHNRTVICKATASNGSTSEITLATDMIPEDDQAPVITHKVDGNITDNQRKITLMVEDRLNTNFVTEDTNVSLHIEGSMMNFTEGEPVMTDNAGITTVNKEASFIVTKAGSYTVYAYDMNNNFSKHTFDVELDNVKPVLTNLTPEATQKERASELVLTITNESGTITCAGQTYNVSNAGDLVRIPVRKNGTYAITAEDVAGNKTLMDVVVNHLDDTKPVITAESDGKYTFSYRDFESEDELKDEILKRITATDDSNEEVQLAIEFTTNVEFNRNTRYVAIVTATDAYGNETSKYIYITMQYNEVVEHKELDTFGVNGEVLVKDCVITTDSKTLNFVNIPEGAVVTYAKGKNTGAQMKYRGTILEGNTLTVTEKDYYTIMVKLSDYTVHVYYVAIN